VGRPHRHLLRVSHHWPRFGGDDARAFIALQRDVYRWMHDQTLRLANHGHTPDEIADELSLPECFSHQSHVQGYYGTVSHNVRSVYNRYLGWYDGNPANLHPLPPVEAAGRYVEMMGGADNVIAGARRAYSEGEYRWVAQVLNHVVFDDPANAEARRLSADAMEQLGYQSESATWRNAYLWGAFELRHGSLQLGRARQPAMARAMTGDLLIDAMGVRFNPDRFRDRATILWRLTDLDEAQLVEVSNHAISQRRLPLDAEPATTARRPDCDRRQTVDVVVGLDRATMVTITDEAERFGPLVDDGTITDRVRRRRGRRRVPFGPRRVPDRKHHRALEHPYHHPTPPHPPPPKSGAQSALRRSFPLPSCRQHPHPARTGEPKARSDGRFHSRVAGSTPTLPEPGSPKRAQTVICTPELPGTHAGARPADRYAVLFVSPHLIH
jgi:hypothetical protein